MIHYTDRKISDTVLCTKRLKPIGLTTEIGGFILEAWCGRTERKRFILYYLQHEMIKHCGNRPCQIRDKISITLFKNHPFKRARTCKFESVSQERKYM